MLDLFTRTGRTDEGLDLLESEGDGETYVISDYAGVFSSDGVEFVCSPGQGGMD